MRMRQETFKSVIKAFSLPGAHLQMMKDASTVFVDMKNVSDGVCHGVSSMSSRQDQRLEFIVD
jgi:hypothetical protein